jgi:AraC-like DNA-binding protein
MTTSSAPITLVNAYEGEARGERYDHWREEICRGFFSVEIDPSREGVIDMHAEIANLQPAAIAISSGTSAIIGRSCRTNADGLDDFTFVCHTQGLMHFRHRDRIFDIGDFQVCLGDSAEPAAAMLRECREFTALKINRKSLLARTPLAEDLLFEPMSINAELSNTIGRYASLIVRTAPHLDAQGRLLMSEHLIDLVGLALGARSDEAESARKRGLVQARLALMKSDVLAHLERPELSIGAVARRHSVSLRQAQRLFSDNGETFTEFLTEQRLLLARKLLLNPRHGRLKISDVAQSAGFSDLSYFNRAFRRRFGMTPTDMRVKPSRRGAD